MIPGKRYPLAMPDPAMIAMLILVMAFATACDKQGGSYKSSVVASSVSDTGDWQSVERAIGLAASPQRESTVKAPPISDLLTSLEAKVHNDPGNKKQWVLLMNSYGFLGRMEDAERALIAAVELGASESQLRAQLMQIHTGQASFHGR